MLFSKRIAALEGQVADLQNQLTTVTSERDEARSQLSGFEGFVSPEAHQAVVTERDQAKADLTALKADMPKQVNKQASAKAVEIASSVGVPPVDSEHSGGKPKAGADVLAHYRSLPVGSVERQEYFRAHKSEIYAAQQAEQNAPLDRRA